MNKLVVKELETIHLLPTKKGYEGEEIDIWTIHI